MAAGERPGTYSSGTYAYDGADGDIVALSPGAPAVINGEAPFRAVSAVAGGTAYPAYGADFKPLPRGGLPVLASAFSPDPFIIYRTGVYRVKTDGGYISEFYADFKAIKEGYGVAKRGGKLALGVAGDEYEYTEHTKYYNIDGFISAAISLDDVPEHNKLHYRATPDDDGITLKELYINYPAYYPQSLTELPRDKLENIAKFKTVIPENWTPDEGAPLKYAYFEPTPNADADARPGSVPLVVWLHGSGFGSNVWDTFFSDSDASPNYIAKWASEEFQARLGDNGAYILAPSANVHPVIGSEHRWGDAGGDQIELTFELIDAFIAARPDIDANRIYIGGFSVGAGMTMLLARKRPDFFAAAFPCSPTARTLYGGGDPQNPDDEVAESLARLPIWLFHSDAEGLSTVDNKLSEAFAGYMLEVAAANGTDSRYTVFGGGRSVAEPFPATAFTLPDGASVTYGHGIAWAAALNDLLYDDGTSYLEGGETVTRGGRIPGGAATTLFAWLAAQSRAGDKIF
ncbi:MAG: hypothetical protein LBL25_00590 [Oscillospiraceae bacterium]|nr:hypothetical protein [Oscillospiraceae bacterium]